MNNVIKRTWLQNKMVSVEWIGTAFQAESGGHTFEISGADGNGNAVALSGTVSGVFLRPDNTDVAITGTASGGVASVTLPAECYAVPGQFALAIYVTANGQKTAVYSAIGTVARTSSGTVAPGATADVVDLINRISAAVATIPASWSGLMADIAPTYSESAVYPVGAYVYYNGDLYRCTTAITTAETWTAAHWTAAVIGNDLSNLNSALNELPKVVETVEDIADFYLSDAQGNVIAQFSGGHVQTKNFDSADVPTQEDLEEVAEDVMKSIPDAVEEAVKGNLPNIPKIALTTGSSASLDIADAQGNVLVRFKDGHIQTQNFDSSETQEQGFEWKFSGSDLLLGYGYNDTIDAVVVLNEGRANGLFDFAKLCSKPKGTPLEGLETADLTVIWNSGTDMHGPFQFLAVNNPDGEHADATDPSFTGGNHTLNDQGSNWKTASSKGVRYFADGRQVTNGHGRCNHFEMRWANGVQAYNTAVEGGTGRECLIEYHDMVFDGIRFDEQIRLVPSEEIQMKLWYGLQFVGFGSIYSSICFRDAANRQIYTNPESNVKSGNAVTSAMLAYGTSDAIELTVDTTVDLGTRDGFYTGDSGAFASPSIHKGYFNIINKSAKVDMPANTTWYLNGSFRFFAA